MNKVTLGATCAFGMESVLKREVSELAFENISVTDGLVTFESDLGGLIKANMALRCANRVLLLMGSFEAKSFDALYDGVYSLDWQNFIGKDFSFNSAKISSVRSALFSKSDCQRIIKKAAAEKLKKAHRVSVLPETGPVCEIYTTVKNDVASLWLNTSGSSLSRRGYRQSTTKAPLIETLAAGIVLLSHCDGRFPFADFMCGSGTIAIEAAMIAANIMPGLNRSFNFEKWGTVSAQSIKYAREEARDSIKEPEHNLLASDIDYFALKAAKENAARAGVDKFISFQKLDFREFSSKKRSGTIICNPPYGERLSDRIETETLYRDMRKVYDSLDAWRLYVLCANPDFERCFGKRADKNRKLYNGNMLTYLLMYFAH